MLFNILPRYIIAFLPRSNRLLISWLQSPTICSDFRAQEEICHFFHVSPSIFHVVMVPDAIILGLFFFLIFSFKPALLLSFTLIKRFFGSSLLSAVRVVSSTYLMLLMFFSPPLIPACSPSSPAFLVMCSVYRLNKQDDSRGCCHTPFSILNLSVFPYRVLTVASNKQST